MPEIIECKFNIFQEGRTYTGHHRKYMLESAISSCYDPKTREKIALREAVGFFGHGRREMAGKVKIREVEAIKLPNGATVITENVPACVTVGFEIDKEGNVTHRQEILDTAAGKAISALNRSRVGGFSWACGGADGGAMGLTRLTSFEGFDYVIDPGFSANRGYVLESAGEPATLDMILESISSATGVERPAAEAAFHNWVASGMYEAAILRNNLEQASVIQDSLQENIEGLEGQLVAVKSELATVAASTHKRQQLIMECASKSTVHVPESVLTALVNMNSESDLVMVSNFLEAAGRVNLETLPVGQHKKIVLPNAGFSPARDIEPGSAAAAAEFVQPFSRF